ncbi:hypothetical protein HG536_0F02980 [Torulaspora globosa]|uniref:Sulfhydryl oxidase n=1 Tax=Torulaspora globosa TaxID=48254 RepID=A0A7G3ZKD7_9SACH|nr:uncharacterized protein HG536_0F02980 [Torulaspora globosa]QLL33973.1 hypothetical protein HG536_0F02980 [Torulaspora globosa]
MPTEGHTGRKIIYDEDGKPCRSCNTLLDFKFATGRITSRAALPERAGRESRTIPAQELIPGSKSYAKVEPPDVVELGNSSWNLLHSITATYPSKPSEQKKAEMKQFLTIFSHIYPCSWCARDFEKFIEQNAPKVDSREDLGRWMCEAHNAVNEKLGKEKFDCNFWAKRWKDGWDEN